MSTLDMATMTTTSGTAERIKVRRLVPWLQSHTSADAISRIEKTA